MEALTTLLSETTLSGLASFGTDGGAPVERDLDEEDLWGPQVRSSNNADDEVVPLDMQILPDPATRKHLVELYYKVRTVDNPGLSSSLFHPHSSQLSFSVLVPCSLL
jgi:hypothetical protein